MGDPDDDASRMLTSLAQYIGEQRRCDVARANAASRAIGLPLFVSACDRDHALGVVLRMLEREYPEVYRRALEVVAKAQPKG